MPTIGPRSRLLVFRFPPGAVLRGELVGALERIALRDPDAVRDGLCVARDPDDGALEAVDLALVKERGGLADLLDFRLAPGRRRMLTAWTLMTRPGGVPPRIIRAIGAQLEPGAVTVAVLLRSGAGIEALTEAAARCGGGVCADDDVPATKLAVLGEELLRAVAAARRPDRADRAGAVD